MKYKNILNLNTPEIPCPGSHYFTASKLCKGFEQLGLRFIEINDIQDLYQYNSVENIILLSDHVECINNLNFLYEVGPKMKMANFLCWHFNKPYLINNIPFEKYILTGEFYRKKPTYSEGYVETFNLTSDEKKWLPFIFSSSINPKDVGHFEKNIIYDSCFIGAPYKQDWIASLNNCFSYFSDSQSIFLPEESRIDAYKKSRVCLGFHSIQNIANSCVVERVFEGMTYGCAVISDNKAAEECTDGIVKYVSSIEEVNFYIDLYKKDESLFKKIQKRGYEYIKNKGTYLHLAEKFITKLNELYE